MNKILIRFVILIISIIPAYICAFLIQKILIAQQIRVHPGCNTTKFVGGLCTDTTGGVEFTLAFPVFLIIFYSLLIFIKNKFIS